MSLLIDALSIVLFFNCLLLIVLVLVQLPKKEAGAGLAFGAGASDALFGAGSGNMLTKFTKYIAGGFFALSLILAIASARTSGDNSGNAFIKALGSGTGGAIPISSSGASSPTPAPAPESKGGSSSAPVPLLSLSNAPAPAMAATNK